MSKEPTVIYEDQDVVVSDKAAGLMRHRDGRDEGETLIDWILETYPEMKMIGEPLVISDEKIIARPGVVHRLDKDTSGVLILARNDRAHAFLKRQFMEQKVRKVYRAFAYGSIAADRGTIDRPIGKSRTDFRQWSAQKNPRGVMREARTDFRVIARSREASYLELFPHTGRTHQIRVHLKAINHPVMCDPLYAPGRPCYFGMDRLALHALSLKIMLPSKVEKVFEAPLPQMFKDAEEAMKMEAQLQE